MDIASKKGNSKGKHLTDLSLLIFIDIFVKNVELLNIYARG